MLFQYPYPVSVRKEQADRENPKGDQDRDCQNGWMLKAIQIRLNRARHISVRLKGA